jgi:hypothetical protein
MFSARRSSPLVRHLTKRAAGEARPCRFSLLRDRVERRVSRGRRSSGRAINRPSGRALGTSRDDPGETRSVRPAMPRTPRTELSTGHADGARALNAADAAWPTGDEGRAGREGRGDPHRSAPWRESVATHDGVRERHTVRQRPRRARRPYEMKTGQCGRHGRGEVLVPGHTRRPYRRARRKRGRTRSSRPDHGDPGGATARTWCGGTTHWGTRAHRPSRKRDAKPRECRRGPRLHLPRPGSDRGNRRGRCSDGTTRPCQSVPRASRVWLGLDHQTIR